MRKRYSEQERNEALKLAKEIGCAAAARRLGINVDTIYTWQSKEKRCAKTCKELPSTEDISAEMNRLREKLKEREQEIEILQDALDFFVKRRKK